MKFMKNAEKAEAEKVKAAADLVIDQIQEEEPSAFGGASSKFSKGIKGNTGAAMKGPTEAEVALAAK